MSQDPLNNLEERAAFLTRSLLSVIKLARRQSTPEMDQALAALQNKLSVEEASLSKLESLMEPVKNQIIQLELGIITPSSPLETEEVPGSADLVDHLKNFYLETLGQLDVELDGLYNESLERFRLEVFEARTLDKLLKKRSGFEELVRRYAQSVFEERTRAATFISEIVSRLADLETQLAASMERIQKNQNQDMVFSRKLEKHITETATSVLRVDKLEELKQLVISRLNSIAEALRKKRRRDEVQNQGASQEFSEFSQQFKSAQQEIDLMARGNDCFLERLKYDCLTGVFNRILYEEYLKAEIARYKRYKRPFSIIVFDLDHFKKVNDTYGHTIGDRCLKEVIENIRPILRENDFLARYGGDEFVILLPETDGSQCFEVAEKIRQAIENVDFTVRGEKLFLTISVGATEVTKDDDSGTSIFERADQGLYKAKEKGRNIVCVV